MTGKVYQPREVQSGGYREIIPATRCTKRALYGVGVSVFIFWDYNLSFPIFSFSRSRFQVFSFQGLVFRFSVFKISIYIFSGVSKIFWWNLRFLKFFRKWHKHDFYFWLSKATIDLAGNTVKSPANSVKKQYISRQICAFRAYFSCFSAVLG
jgi:hypothetical protein